MRLGLGLSKQQIGSSQSFTEIDWAFGLVDASETFNDTTFPNNAITGFEVITDALVTCDNHDGFIRFYNTPTDGDIGSIDPSTDRVDAKQLSMQDFTGEVGGANDPSDVMFLDDGDSMIIISKDLQYLYWLDLSTAYNPSTATLNNSKSVDLSALPTPIPEPTHVAFNEDGSKMFITDRDNIEIHEFDLSTNYDPSTLTLNTVHDFSLDFTATSPTLRFCVFRLDGTQVYLGGKTTNDTEPPVFAYTLSTAYDLSTASRDSSLDFSMPSDATVSEYGDIQFNETERKVYMSDVYANSLMETLTGNVIPSALLYTGQDIGSATQVDGLFQIVGNVFTGETFNSRSMITQLNSNTVALINNDDNEIQNFTYSDPNWSASGTNFSTSTVGNNNDIAYLADNEIIYSHNGSDYQALSHNGTSYSTNGSSVNLGTQVRVAGSSATRIFVQDASSNTMSCYDLSGGTWTQTGNPLSVTYFFQSHAITLLDKTVDAEIMAVHVVDNGTPADSYISVYQFDGTDFTELTSTRFTSTDIDNNVSSLVAISSNEVVYLDNTEILRHFSIDGSYNPTQTAGKATNLADLTPAIIADGAFIGYYGAGGNFVLSGAQSGAGADSIALLTY
jgi:hypothetical protein